MYRERLDFAKITKAIDNTYQLLSEKEATEKALHTLKEAELNVQQALTFSLSSPVIRSSNIDMPTTHD